MIRISRFLSAGIAALALCSVLPLNVSAQGHVSACPPAKPHALPKGAATTTVIRFGVKGGSLRPWSATLALGGAVTTTGTTGSREQLKDPKNTLTALITLADAQGFFSLKKMVGCVPAAGNPDVSTRFLSIHTSTGTKSVQEIGSCASTAKYDQLYDVVEATTGIGS